MAYGCKHINTMSQERARARAIEKARRGRSERESKARGKRGKGRTERKKFFLPA